MSYLPKFLVSAIKDLTHLFNKLFEVVLLFYYFTNKQTKGKFTQLVKMRSALNLRPSISIVSYSLLAEVEAISCPSLPPHCTQLNAWNKEVFFAVTDWYLTSLLWRGECWSKHIPLAHSSLCPVLFVLLPYSSFFLTATWIKSQSLVHTNGKQEIW